MLDHLIYRPRRQQSPPLPLVTGLGALPMPRGTPCHVSACSQRDRHSAARKNSASCDSADAPTEQSARPDEQHGPPAAQSGDPSPTALQLQPHAPPHRSPQPPHAPHPRIRQSRVMSPHQLNAYTFQRRIGRASGVFASRRSPNPPQEFIFVVHYVPVEIHHRLASTASPTKTSATLLTTRSPSRMPERNANAHQVHEVDRAVSERARIRSQPLR